MDMAKFLCATILDKPVVFLKIMAISIKDTILISKYKSAYSDTIIYTSH